MVESLLHHNPYGRVQSEFLRSVFRTATEVALLLCILRPLDCALAVPTPDSDRYGNKQEPA